MSQYSFLPLLDPTNHIVNVASVPQRSPFRYPGGKTWLVPWVRTWVTSRRQPPAEFIEPFAGGGIVGLTVAAEALARHVTLVELDDQVAAVWQTILQDPAGGVWLGERIMGFELTEARVREVLACPPANRGEQAFQTILKNRVQRGGILANGAGLIKQGEAGKGLASRWYPATLQRRILDIVALRERISFLHGDGLHVLASTARAASTVFFIDPPYSAGGKRAGTRLYTHNVVDHAEIFRLATLIKGDFLMTYDNAPEVRALAAAHGFDIEPVAMKNTHHAQMTELLIGRSLDWARRGVLLRETGLIE